MPRPTRVRYTGIAPFIDDTQANRVQALGSSTRLTTEDMKELGTLNIVEIVDDIPQVDVSIDQNENGTLDLLALFANKGYGCQVVAVPSGNQVGSNKVKVRPGSYIANGNRIYFEGTELTITGTATTYVYLKPEVSGGASAKVATSTTLPSGSNILLATISGSAVSGGVIDQASIVDNRPATLSKVEAVDYELAYVDIYVPVKESSTGGVARTQYLENVYVNNIDLSYQTSGVATNSFRLETDNKRWFLNNASQIVVDEFKSSGGATLTLSQTPTQLSNGKYVLCLYKNGTKLNEGTDFTVNAGTKTVTFTQALTNGDLVKVRYTSSNGGKWFNPVPAVEDPHPELAGGIKQGQVEIYLVDKSGNVDAQRTCRVQSARISLPLTREQLNELGALQPYARPLQLPVNVNVSLELRDSDLLMMARFAGYTDLTGVKEISINDLVKNMGLLIKIYRENDIKRAKLPAGHPDKYAIKTIKVVNLIPQGENWDVRVDSDATQTFEFLAHNLTIEDKLVL